MTGPGLISCLCVTEGRSAFMPWLLWGYDRQTWRDRELIIVDSSAAPWRTDRPDVRVIPAPPGTNVPTKRNLALAAAMGTIVAWFDDDDWQHPQRLALVGQALAEDPRAIIAGGTRSFFVDLHGDTCRKYDGYGTIIFNGAGFRREAAQAVPFNEAQRRASDTGWMQALTPRGGHCVVAPQILTVWLSHEQNISNDRRRWRFPLPLSALRGDVGAAMWADTDERLAALRAELPSARSSPSLSLLPILSERAMAPPRGQQRAMRLRQILASQAARRHPSQPGTPVARGADELAQVDSRRRVADARRRIASSRAGAEPGAPFSIIACFSEAEIGSAAALLPHFARLVGRAPRTAVALVGAEPQEAGASPGGDLPPWDAVVRVAVPRARERLEPAMTREALLEAVVRADGADLLLLVAGSGAVVDAGQIPWIDLASSRLRTDPDLVAIAIPHGGVRGARGAARGAPPGVKGATWDSRLRLWRGRGVTGLAFVTDRRRLRDALETRAGAPDRAEPLASVLEDVLGGTVAKSFGTLATKEAWTLRLPTSLRIAEPGASPNRQSV